MIVDWERIEWIVSQFPGPEPMIQEVLIWVKSWRFALQCKTHCLALSYSARKFLDEVGASHRLLIESV
jgi:hypothetical protein